MKCDDFQKALLAGELEAGERNRHLESCPECREYARIVEALECPSLPAEFDAAVVAACRRELRRAAFPWRSVLTACCSAAAMIALFFAFHAFSGPEITAESTRLTAAEKENKTNHNNKHGLKIQSVFLLCNKYLFTKEYTVFY